MAVIHTVQTIDAATNAVADCVLKGGNKLIHGAPGSGGTTFLKSFARRAAGLDRFFRLRQMTYHRAINEHQRHQPLSRVACEADLLLLDDFACGYDRSGPFKTRGIQLIAFTGTAYSEVALERWNRHLTRPAPDLVLKLLAQDSAIITRETCHV